MIHSRLKTTLAFLALVYLPITAIASLPVVERLEPRGVVRGEETTISLVGNRLKDAHQVLSDVDGLTILDVKPIDNKKVEITIKTDPTIAPGLYPIRLVTKSGIANLRLLGVGAMPIVKEVEPNNGIETQQPIELNTTIEGVIEREDVDHYAVKLAAGQSLQVEIEGIRLAYSLNNQNILDPYIAILDQGRFELATSDDSAFLGQDGVCSYTAESDGVYTVLVRDSSFGGHPSCSYRLHVGTFPRPVAAIPGGGVPGSTLNAKLIHLSGETEEGSVVLPSESRSRYAVVTENEDGISPSPNWIRVNTLPVVMEDEPQNNNHRKAPSVTVPAALCGVIGQPGDFDAFQFECKKGERYRVNVFARNCLRSPLDAVLNVFGPDYKTIVSSDDVNGSVDPSLEFATKVDGAHTIRIYDHLRGGSPLHQYRIEVEKANPTFALTLKEGRRDQAEVISVPIGGQTATVITASRQGYNDAIEPHVLGLPEGVTATTYPIPKGRSEIPILFTASSEAKHDASLFNIEATGDSKHADVQGNFAQTHKLVLGQNRRGMWSYDSDRAAIAVTDAAPFSIELVQPKTPIVRSGSKDLIVRIVRDKGFNGAVSLRTLYNPPGIGINNSRKIEKGKSEVNIPITANGNAAIGVWPLIMIATYPTSNGNAEIASPPIELEVQDSLFKYSFPRTTAELGTEATVAVEVEVLRDLPSTTVVDENEVAADANAEGTGSDAADAEVELVGIPNGVTCAEPIQKVSKDTTMLTFRIVVAADAKPGKHKTLVCQSRVKVGDEIIHQTNGTGELRLDKPLPVKKVEQPKPKTEEKKAEPKKAEPKPLSRLEQLRQMKQN
ncbi:hypothetical protein Q31b_56730 [Novipirellula aureliae]|uniref:Peptidase C-terminal archaeal/bacterial domain-containing protein n=1 Tax=Novipirellula aureliae TaxID=2527966 RepID=A0A5C6DER3_9BACT|nr:PPC domain-containing protein [Novipirellula aureliae]TWU33616.1 hypothetical protein Q31b_56730 [Novipirellula aureliae]